MKYPIGIQTFSKIREGGFVYVDKTEQIHKILTAGSYFFLSRPRRFGKSLLLSTIKSIFEGRKDLFDGLWIENHWDWSASHPIIHISFSSIGANTIGLEKAILSVLDENALLHGIEFKETAYDKRFKELIAKLSQKGKVVLLIDEYDKPIVDHLENLHPTYQFRRA